MVQNAPEDKKKEDRRRGGATVRCDHISYV